MEGLNLNLTLWFGMDMMLADLINLASGDKCQYNLIGLEAFPNS